MADYIVQAGDTLGKIAKAHGMTVKQLAELNGIKDVNKLHVGQELIFEPKAEVHTEAEGVERTMSDEEVAARLAQQTEELQQLKSRTLTQQAREEIQKELDAIADDIVEKYNIAKEEALKLLEGAQEKLEKAYQSGKEAYFIAKEAAISAAKTAYESTKNAAETAYNWTKDTYNSGVDAAENYAKNTAQDIKEGARKVHDAAKFEIEEPKNNEPDINTMTQEELLAYNDQLIQQLRNESLTDRAKREIKEELQNVENKLKSFHNSIVDKAYTNLKNMYNTVKDNVKSFFNALRW